MALEMYWETVKDSIFAYTGLSPTAFFTAIVMGFALYYRFSDWFASSEVFQVDRDSSEAEESQKPLPPPVLLGEVTVEELKQYDGSDPDKPLLMAIKGQIYDVSQSRMFYGPGGPYALFAGKDASRALAKMSFDDKDLNGDLTGLGVFELEALRDWEYKFMSKYVKVGTVKVSAPVSVGAATEPVEAANGDVVKPEESEDSSANAAKNTEETAPVVDDGKKD